VTVNVLASATLATEYHASVAPPDVKSAIIVSPTDKPWLVEVTVTVVPALSYVATTELSASIPLTENLT